MRGRGVRDMQVGEQAEFAKTVTEADVILFAGITGDLNPQHIDEAWARGSPFGGRVAHGMLTAAFISTVLGTRLPGPGTIYLSQDLKFKAPVRIGDTVVARVTVEELVVEKSRVRLRTECLNQEGEVVLEGAAWVMVPSDE